MTLRLLLTYLSKNESKPEERNIFNHVFLKFLGRSFHRILWSEYESMILSSKKNDDQDNKELLLVNSIQNNYDVVYSDKQKE